MGGSGDHGHDGHDDVTREELFKEFKPSIKYRFTSIVGSIIDKPVSLFREQVVNRVRTPYPYYHKRYDRVPTIDQCLTNDLACIEEANQQFHRDRLVDLNIVRILRKRKNECMRWYSYQKEDVYQFCGPMFTEYEDAAVNYYIKYGELHWSTSVVDAFMKQKHRLLWEKRYGPVGKTSDEKKKLAEAGDKATKEGNFISKIREIGFSRDIPKEIHL
ncbi:unnamed protein product [Schistosoma mattheei]|uniref:NADH dehydrogenase [ubiquinone] 1 beta subcomplex subunit 10 n=1 Tax=Schistosoma mattheei TaxID=31246 RepID=A0A183NRG0_9TREM|nr:unnamed protein product [Schistosoma mattheei]VDP24631.1 unnamed protein product [Schistosoma mattheei]